MERKKLLLLIFATVILFLILLIFITIFGSQKKTIEDKPVSLITVSPQITKTVPVSPLVTEAEGKIEVRGVKVKDFTRDAKVKNANGDVLIERNDRFSISFLKQFEEFNITVIGQPYAPAIKQAEEEFIRRLEITPDEACMLTVYVGTTQGANPEMAGNIFGLSWCFD